MEYLFIYDKKMNTKLKQFKESKFSYLKGILPPFYAGKKEARPNILGKGIDPLSSHLWDKFYQYYLLDRWFRH